MFMVVAMLVSVSVLMAMRSGLPGWRRRAGRLPAEGGTTRVQICYDPGGQGLRVVIHHHDRAQQRLGVLIEEARHLVRATERWLDAVVGVEPQ